MPAHIVNCSRLGVRLVALSGERRWLLELQDLLKDLAGLEGMLWVIGGGDVVSENSSKGLEAPSFTGGYANIEAENWHVHVKLDTIGGVQFVVSEDHVAPYLYYVRFSSGAEETMFRVYFPNPYLDDDGNRTELQPERFDLFERYRDQYVGNGGIIFVERSVQ